MEKTFQKAHDLKRSSIGLYLSWYKQSTKPIVLDWGLERYPSATLLWIEKINTSKEKEELYRHALTCPIPSDQRCFLWMHYITYIQSTGPSIEKLDGIFQDAIADIKSKSIQDDSLPIAYLKHVFTGHGIESVRSFYKKISQESIVSLDLIHTVLLLEMESWKEKRTSRKDVDRLWNQIHDLDPHNIGTFFSFNLFLK